jgi:transposase
MLAPRKNLTPAEKAYIAGVYSEGRKSLQDLATQFGRSKSTMLRAVRKHDEDPQCERGEVSGRPKKLTEREESHIILSLKRQRDVSCTQIKSDLDLKVSRSTIWRSILSSGLVTSEWKTSKPFVCLKNRRKRVLWCKERVNWSKEDWRKVLWSDESPFHMRNNGKRRVWKFSNEGFHESHYTGTVKHDQKINVWGCFSYTGVGRIKLVNGLMDGKQYVSILRTSMLPSARELFDIDDIDEDWIFQQDNDPKHTSAIASDFFDNQQINVMEWCPYSPDLNPIENLWAILKQRIVTRKCNTVEELWEVVQTAWDELPVDLLNTLVDSMPRRCQAVIDMKGYPTKY